MKTLFIKYLSPVQTLIFTPQFITADDNYFNVGIGTGYVMKIFEIGWY